MTEQELEALEIVPDSQFSMNWSMVDKDGAQVQVTMRKAHLMEWPDVLKTRKAFCEAAQAAGWTFPAGFRPSAPAQAQTTPTSAPNGANGTAPGGLVIRAVKLEVTPRADGKVDAKFFEAGHQYPDLYATKTAGEMAAMLTPGGGGPWVPEKFKEAGQHVVNMAIEYALSERLNKNGKPYKNIVAVRPA